MGKHVTFKFLGLIYKCFLCLPIKSYARDTEINGLWSTIRWQKFNDDIFSTSVFLCNVSWKHGLQCNSSFSLSSLWLFPCNEVLNYWTFMKKAFPMSYISKIFLLDPDSNLRPPFSLRFCLFELFLIFVSFPDQIALLFWWSKIIIIVFGHTFST